jgi:hypothetical protein
METTTQTNQTTNQNPQAAGIPDWVMHLLTGLGTMGAEYMLFIKPLQEKMELQTKLINEQGERLNELEEILQSKRIYKPSNSYQKVKDVDSGDDDEEEDNELFTIKRKPSGLTKNSKNVRVRF